MNYLYYINDIFKISYYLKIILNILIKKNYDE